MRIPSLIALLTPCIAPWVASAHITPLLPSSCTFDVVEVTVPARGLGGTGVAPTPADGWRVLWDASASAGQLCPNQAGACGPTPPARALTGTIGGTLTLPRFAGFSATSGGDLQMPRLRVTLAPDGPPVELVIRATTTAVITAEPALRFGTPLGADGRVELVGIGSTPALFGGAEVQLRLGCALAPRPDLDQLASGGVVSKVAGRIAADDVQLSFTVTPPPGAPFAVTAGSAVVALRDGGQPVVALAFPAGLEPVGTDRWQARSTGGAATLTVRRLRNGSYACAVRDATASTAALAGTVALDLLTEMGDLVARAQPSFRARDGVLRPLR